MPASEAKLRKLGDKILAEVSRLYDDAEEVGRRRTDRTLENAAFYRGFQYRVVDGEAFTDEDDATGEQREVQNIVRAFVRSAVAAKLKQVPNPEIASAHGDQRARARADATEKLAKAFSRNDTINNDELQRCLSWADQVGGGWMKCFWNRHAGKPVSPPDDGFEAAAAAVEKSDANDFGEDLPITVFEGEIQTEFVPTVDLLPDPAAKSPREIRYVFHQKLRPMSELRDKFPTDFFGEPSVWDTGTKSYAQNEYLAINEQDVGMDAAGIADSEQLARIVEFWEMPTNRWPRGRLVVFSGACIIWMGSNPYWPSRLPFVLFYGDNLVPGALYPDGLVEDIKPIQRSLNRTVTKMREMVDRTITPHLLTPYSSGITIDNWDDIPGNVIHYVKGNKPEWMNPPEIPNSLFGYTNELITRAKEITGYSDISRGDVPAGVESGRAIAFLRENEQSIREPDMMSFRRSYIQLMQQCVYLARQFYQDGRMVRVIGTDYRWTLLEFKEDGFDWDNDLVPEVFSGGPNSHALRFSETLELANAGILEPDAPTAKAARQLLGSDYAGKATFDPFYEDRIKARRENLMVEKDPFAHITAREFDEHEVHCEEHNSFRKSQGYEDMPPEQQAVIDHHCEEHESWIQAQEQAYGQSAANLGGGQQQQGQPSPPAQPGLASPPDGGQQPYPSDQPTQEQYLAQTGGQAAAVEQG